jgi:hypothetical protein
LQPRRPRGARGAILAAGLAASWLLASGASPCRAANLPIGRDQRLILGFIEDGAIVAEGWFEASLAGADYDEGGDRGGRVLVALRYGRDVEAGVIAGVGRRRRDAGAPLYGGTVEDSFSRTDATDVMIYGKYRVLRGTFDLSLGASVSVPLAGDASGLTSGALETRGFAGGRVALPGGSVLVAHVGFATAGTSGYSGASGRTALRAGIGGLVPLARIWSLFVEVEHEGAIFEGQDSSTMGLAGLHWEPTQNIAVLMGAGGGGGRAPDLAGILAVAFHF